MIFSSKYILHDAGMQIISKLKYKCSIYSSTIFRGLFVKGHVPLFADEAIS
jgi:hypothetical protein